MASLRTQITTESWMEDVQFFLGLTSREEPWQVCQDHFRDYLANRYQPEVAILECLAVRASYNWLARNHEELCDIGLRVTNSNGTGYVNALLFALHNLIFRTPKPSAWAKISDADSRVVIAEAQEFVNAEKDQKSTPKE